MYYLAVSIVIPGPGRSLLLGSRTSTSTFYLYLQQNEIIAEYNSNQFVLCLLPTLQVQLYIKNKTKSLLDFIIKSVLQCSSKDNQDVQYVNNVQCVQK